MQFYDVEQIFTSSVVIRVAPKLVSRIKVSHYEERGVAGDLEGFSYSFFNAWSLFGGPAVNVKNEEAVFAF